MGIGAPELIIVLVVVLLLFGSTRLPKLAKSLGQASKEFKQGVAEGPSDEDGDDKAKKTGARELDSESTEKPTSPTST